MERKGTVWVWLSSATVVAAVSMLVLMIVLILANGLPQFLPRALELVEMKDGTRYLGELHGEEPGADGATARIQLKVGNRDVYGIDFKWIDVADIARREHPAAAVAVERSEYGHAFGFVEGSVEELRPRLAAAAELRGQVEELFHRIEHDRLPLTRAKQELVVKEGALRAGLSSDAEGVDALRTEIARLEREILPTLEAPERELGTLREELAKAHIPLRLADGQSRELSLANVERLTAPNAMSLPAKAGVYLSELWQFLADDPRESNTEGGVFPAIFGTVMMVMIMTVAVVPFGVLTAVYMHEYARAGRLLRFVRLAVSNLAGVPSIVFGLFGLGFFVYFVGGGIDRIFFSEHLPQPTLGTGGILWASLTLALLTLPSVIVATEEGLASVPRANRDGALALGSTKFQMIKNVVIPQAMPGILTGAILAVSRGAGEVAPLMITGVVKLAREMPFSTEAPYLHLERKFMHLGFHVYDVSMQSPNIEAAKPMVYSATLLLLIIVLVLNSGAIVLRNRLRRRYRGSAL